MITEDDPASSRLYCTRWISLVTPLMIGQFSREFIHHFFPYTYTLYIFQISTFSRARVLKKNLAESPGSPSDVLYFST